MTIKLKSRYGVTLYYNIAQISSIELVESGNLYDSSDLKDSGIKDDELFMVITFKDGKQSTFSSDWRIVF